MCHLHYSAHTCAYYLYIGVIDMKKSFLSILVLLLFVVLPVWADDTPTYQYIQFSGNGRTVLLDTNGALSVVNATDDAPAGDGYQWTLEASTTATGTVLLKSKAGHYVSYDATAHTFGTTSDASAATTFTQSANTYYNKTAGGSRYNLTISTLTGSNALAVKNGQLTLSVSNARYSAIRLASSVKGPIVNPLLSTEGNEHWYYMELISNGSECIKDATDGSKLQKTNTPQLKYLSAYMWCVYEANEQGDVYFKSKAGHYIYQADGTFQYVTSAESNRNNRGRYQICDVADQNNYAGTYILYNSTTGKYVMPYQSGNPDVGMGSYVSTYERMRFIETKAQVLTTPHVVQFSANGSTVLYDEANGQVSIKATTNVTNETNNFTWTFEPITGQTDAYALKSGWGNYLKYADNAFSTTTQLSEALAVFPNACDYDRFNKRYTLTLAADAEQALGCQNGTLTLTEANSLYTVVNLANSLSEVKGEKQPQILDISNTYYYKIQFKANATGNKQLTLTTNHFDAPVAAIEASPAVAQQNWIFKAAKHPDCRPGDFYIMNHVGEFLCFDDGTFYIRTQFDVNKVTVYRLIQSVTDPTCWSIEMPLVSDNDRMVGLSASDKNDYAIKRCGATSAYNALTFKASPAVSMYNYFQFSGSGRTVLYEHDGQLSVVETTESQLKGDGYQWTYELATHNGQDVGIYAKAKTGRYLRYDAATQQFSSVTNREDATVLLRTQNTYFSNTAGDVRFNFSIRGNTDTYNTIGVKNGRLQLVKANSRYAALRYATDIKGATFIPYVSTADKQYFYHIDMRRNGSEFLVDNTSGQLLQKTSNTVLPLRILRWSLYEANDDGDIYIKSYAGNYIYLNGRDQYVTNDETLKTNKGRYKLCDVADQSNAAYDEHWVIYSYSGKQFMSPYDANTNKVGLDPNLQVKERVRFTELSASDSTYRYLLFPAMGMKALIMGYDEMGQRELKARTPSSQDDNPDVYLWRINQLHLQNKAGYYISYADGKWGVTDNETDAYTFDFSFNTYENNNVTRDNFLSTDGTQALSVDESGNLYWGQPNTRYSVSRLIMFPVAPKLPQFSADGVSYQLYRLQTFNDSHYNYTKNADDATITLQPTAENNLRQLWVLVRDGGGLGDCYVQNTYDRTFLKCNTTATNGSVLSTVSDIAQATHVRLIENDAQSNMWQLQVTDVSGKNNVLRHIYNKSTSTITLDAPNNGRNYINFVPVDITLEFYDEDGGAYHQFTLSELTDQPLLVGNATTLGIEKGNSEINNNNSWKNVGNKLDFVLRNANGMYVTADADGQVSLTTDKTVATHFYLWMNHSLSNGNITFSFAQLPADGKIPTAPNLCLGLADDGQTIQLLPFSTYITEGKHTLCFSFSAPTSPDLTTDAETGKNFYYFVHFDKMDNRYMSDGRNENIDAIAEGKQSVNDQMWAFVGQSKEDFVVISKDKYYLYFNSTKQNFDVTHDKTLAAHFSASYVSSVDRYVFTLIGGANTEGVTNKLLRLSSSSSDIILGQATDLKNADNAKYYYLKFEQIEQPEDYSDYFVRPKRSWFVKQVRNAQVKPMTGFIQRDEEGWTLNPYTKHLMQKTSTYTITHYLKCQSTRDIYIPTCMVGSASTRSRAYQRWYNYKTDEAVDDSVVYLGINSSRKYNNGLVVGDQLYLNGSYGGFVDHTVTFQMPENVPDDWEYILGADMTTYTDFVDYFGDNGNPLYSGETNSTIAVPDGQDLIEPTITGRNLFVFRNARAIANELLNYREGSDKWYEEKTIAFPRKKITLNVSTVNLNMQKSDYWFYKAATPAEDNLQNAVSYGGKIDIEIDPQGTGITSAGFQSNGLPGTERAIGFNYLGDKDGFGKGEATAEQCVLKVYGHASDGIRYQIAKFTLLFEEDFEPRLYTEVIGKTPDGHFLTDRSPEALKQNVGEPVATITFDPELFETFVTPPVGTNTSLSNSGAGEGASQTHSKNYRYPFNYDNTSYCFAPVNSNYYDCTWGNYTIANKLDATENRGNFYPIKKFYQDFYGPAYDASQSGFLYIDASDLPGQVVSIDFAGQPCSGSRLYVSAWMSSPERDKGSPANVVFHIQGIKDGKATTIYSYCPGPILGQARDKNGKTWNNNDNNSIGLWQQVFFNFVNKSTAIYDTYRLTIDNACINTKGGDILIDDIEVFALKPTVQLERTTPVCSQQITLAKMNVDFGAVLQQLGLKENETPVDGNPNIWYCILDKKLYDKELLVNATDPAHYTPSHTDVWRAFTKALVGDPNATTGPERAFRHIEFTTHYTDDAQLPPFNYKQALHGIDAQRFKEISGTGVRYFIISDKMKGANLQPHHDYYVLFKPRFSSEPITIYNAVDAFELGTNCSIMSTFRSESAIKVVEDADDDASVDHEAQTCAGKSVSLSVKQNGVDDDGSQPQRITQYDWWRDYIGGSFTQVVINTQQGTWRTLAQGEVAAADEMSLREALMNFRHFYPTATTVAGATPQTDAGYSLSQVEVDVLLQLTQNHDGQLAPLLLYNNTCNVYVPADKTQGSLLNVTVVPINNTSLDGTTQYCYDPDQISIKVSGYAPQLYDGLNGDSDTYPAYLTNVPVRTSLAALAQVTEPAADVPAANVLRLPLRGIQIVTPNAVGLQYVKAEADDEARVYLAGTTDPNMPTYVTQRSEGSTEGSVEGSAEEPSAQSFRVVGKVKHLEAMVADAAHAYADIYFTHDFTPREGYTYTLRIDYRERFATGSTATSLACDGALLADLVIVPKYQVWIGAAGNTDWTNDANWQRADRSDLLFDNATETAYLSNTTNGTAQGFAPMSHTSVLINGNAAVGGPHLYATTNNGPDGDAFVHFVDHEGEQRTATRDIEYALLAAQQATLGVNLCERYTTYQTKDVVLQPHAELLHSERLHYQKAWMEYALNPDRWYTLGSPLQQTYAGDWYAPKANAQQATPYFDDITFNVDQYNRFSPAVYQRSWDIGSALLYQLEPYSADAHQPANVGTRNVYQAATWSQVYNDVQTPYTQGGFSVKVASVGTATTYTSSLFRLPKEDAEFGYYTTTGATDGKTYAVDRTLNHRLLSDKLTKTDALTLTLHNATAANAYYLVSNPFTCGLNMQQFFAQNALVLDGAKYWMLTATGQTGVMQNANDAQWTVVNADNAATAQGVVAPGQGFFVKAKQATGSLQLTFTPGMMTSAHAVGSVLKLPARRALRANNVLGTLHVTAERNGQRSEAIVVKDAAANNAYAPNEDMEALVDNSLASVPTLYTLAGTQASSVNRRNSMFRVPLGVLSNSDAPTRLTFTGMAGFSETLSLLDEQTGFVTPLTLGTANDSVTVEVPGNTVGRYYILSSEQPTADDLQQLTRPIIQVDGQRVVITSSAAHVLTHVQVVDAAGRTLYMMTPYMATLSLKLPTGAYVIEAQTTEGKTISKVTL